MSDGNEVHGRVVDIESFVIEVHEAAVDHAVRALQAMSNHTPDMPDCRAKR